MYESKNEICANQCIYIFTRGPWTTSWLNQSAVLFFMFSTRHITLWLLNQESDVAVCIVLDHDNHYLILWFVYSWICLLNNRFKFRKCSVSDSVAPVMFSPLNVRLEYWFQHVTFMLKYVLQSRNFHGEVPGFATDWLLGSLVLWINHVPPVNPFFGILFSNNSL